MAYMVPKIPVLLQPSAAGKTLIGSMEASTRVEYSAGCGL